MVQSHNWKWLPAISAEEFAEHIEEESFPVQYGNPVRIYTGDVVFSHGGLADAFVRRYIPGRSYNDVDTVLQIINSFGCGEMWQDASSIWYRPQYYGGELYQSDTLLQVVGHTPVEKITREGNLISCDVFSTDRDRKPIGTQEYLIIDTLTWAHQGIR